METYVVAGDVNNNLKWKLSEVQTSELYRIDIIKTFSTSIVIFYLKSDHKRTSWKQNYHRMKKKVCQQMVTSSNVKLKLGTTLRRALFTYFSLSLSVGISASQSLYISLFSFADACDFSKQRFPLANSSPYKHTYNVFNVWMYVWVILEEIKFVRQRQIEFSFHFR